MGILGNHAKNETNTTCCNWDPWKSKTQSCRGSPNSKEDSKNLATLHGLNLIHQNEELVSRKVGNPDGLHCDPSISKEISPKFGSPMGLQLQFEQFNTCLKVRSPYCRCHPRWSPRSHIRPLLVPICTRLQWSPQLMLPNPQPNNRCALSRSITLVQGARSTKHKAQAHEEGCRDSDDVAISRRFNIRGEMRERMERMKG